MTITMQGALPLPSAFSWLDLHNKALHHVPLLWQSSYTRVVGFWEDFPMDLLTEPQVFHFFSY